MLHAMGVGSGDAVNSSGERVVFDIVFKLFDPPYCFFDVGANEGQFLDSCIHAGRKTVTFIHSFEPVDLTFKKLTTKAGNFPNVKLNKLALGSKEETRPIFFNKDAMGLASLYKRDLVHFGLDSNETEIINVETFDNYIQGRSIEKVHLLKIDVEGNELEVLKGAQSSLSKGLVELIMFEFGGTHIDTRVFFKDYWHFLTNNRFKIFRITPSGYLYEIERYRELLEIFTTTNFLAARKELRF